MANDRTAYYTQDQYHAAVSELKKLGALRAESIRGQLDGSIPSTASGQNKVQAALIDASAIDLTVLGSMMGGGGNRDGGNRAFGERGNRFGGGFGGFNGEEGDKIPFEPSNEGVLEDVIAEGETPIWGMPGSGGDVSRMTPGYDGTAGQEGIHTEYAAMIGLLLIFLFAATLFIARKPKNVI